MSNEEQIAYWNGDAGRKWAEKDHMMAQMLGPIARDLMQHCDPAGAKALLDVGCGGGSETLFLAERLGGQAQILGIDVSAPLLAVARDRLAGAQGNIAKISFEESDAATHEFTPDTYDFLFSRFGVMFFDDPVAAFKNLRSALTADARLAFCCWQSMQDNPWVTLPLQAALQHLPPPPKPEPNAPGPFAFADRDRVMDILTAAGFADIAIEPHAVEMGWGSGGDLASTAREMLNIGPVGRLLLEQDESTRERVYSTVADTLAPYFDDGRFHLPGATWFVTARNTSV